MGRGVGSETLVGVELDERSAVDLVGQDALGAALQDLGGPLLLPHHRAEESVTRNAVVVELME